MRTASLVVVALMITAVVASAQTPYIAVYFNPGLSQQTKDCPGVNVLDVLYVAGLNFNSFVGGAEFQIQYPPAITWLADSNLPDVVVGNTFSGISMGWPLPQNAFGPFLMCTVNVLWNCETCVDPYVNNMIKVVANPATLFIGFTDYPQNNLVPAVGMTSLICATVPAEDTTWGQVKALYGE